MDLKYLSIASVSSQFEYQKKTTNRPKMHGPEMDQKQRPTFFGISVITLNSWAPVEPNDDNKHTCDTVMM